MTGELALQLLGELMEWDAADAEQEFKRLQILSTYKYDQYADFVAGSRFLENLGRWLQQFESVEERRVAYRFVRSRLLFITNAEIERLVESFFPQFLYYDVLDFVAKRFGVELYQGLADAERQIVFGDQVRRSLIIGVSDGARTDLLRRFNVGRISNDQVLLSTDFDLDRLVDLQKALRKAVKDDDARFTRVYLLDDFTASGTTFFHRDEDGTYGGKLHRFLKRFSEQLKDGGPTAIERDALIRIHHFIGTAHARLKLEEVLSTAESELRPRDQWFSGNVRMSFGHVLGSAIPLTNEAGGATYSSDEPFLALCRKYYDRGIEKPEHGQVDLQYGYKCCGLPLVFQHNTPNNSITLLWKESDGSVLDGVDRAMYSLFCRRERH